MIDNFEMCMPTFLHKYGSTSITIQMLGSKNLIANATRINPQKHFSLSSLFLGNPILRLHSFVNFFHLKNHFFRKLSLGIRRMNILFGYFSLFSQKLAEKKSCKCSCGDASQISLFHHTHKKKCRYVANKGKRKKKSAHIELKCCVYFLVLRYACEWVRTRIPSGSKAIRNAKTNDTTNKLSL